MAEAAECLKRDQDQQQKLIERHLTERRELQLQMKRLRDRHEIETVWAVPNHRLVKIDQ